MTPETLHDRFFKEGTPGRRLIRGFYTKYRSLLEYWQPASLEDVVHEVFVSISGADFRQVSNIEHYVLRAIKLRCWALADRASRRKATVVTSSIGHEPEGGEPEHGNTPGPGPAEWLDSNDLMAHIAAFKCQLKPQDASILNMLIDESPRDEIASKLRLNINTLDTHIRRIRLRLATYLRGLGYSHPSLQRFTE